MSPIKTLSSYGDSSRLVLRRMRPSCVNRSPHLRCLIVLKFVEKKWLTVSPGRMTRYSSGDLVRTRIITAKFAMGGAKDRQTQKGGY